MVRLHISFVSASLCIFFVFAGSNCDIAEGVYCYCFTFVSGIFKCCCFGGEFWIFIFFCVL